MWLLHLHVPPVVQENLLLFRGFIYVFHIIPGKKSHYFPIERQLTVIYI